MGKPLISLAQIAEEDPYYLDIDEKPDWQSQFKNSNPLKLEIGFWDGKLFNRNGSQRTHQQFYRDRLLSQGNKKVDDPH